MCVTPGVHIQTRYGDVHAETDHDRERRGVTETAQYVRCQTVRAGNSEVST